MRATVHRVLLSLVLLLLATPATAQKEPAFDLQAAINAAKPGSVLQVPAGLYLGSVVVDRPIHLIGIDGANGEQAIIDGQGKGSVLTITASGASVENMVIRNSGNVIDKEDAGVVVERAEDVQLIGNRLEEVLYGVRSAEAHRLILRNNTISGMALDVARRGDGLRIWQSEDSLVEGNTVEGVRDVLFWFSDGATVRNNTFQSNRYGIHIMYTDNMSVMDNYFSGNSVGAYMMYSVNVQIAGNTFRNNRGPSGYGLAFKDVDGAAVWDNYFLDNRVGVFFDNTPARVDIEQQIERNVLAYNDIGVLMMPAIQRNVFQANSFLDNLEQVGVKGGGSHAGDQLGGNRWDGNFWSDYVGYDDNGQGAADGVGDLPYRAESLFENISDRHQNLKLFHFSPVESAIDMAARAFPVIKPKPKLTDAVPLMAPVMPLAPAIVEPGESQIGWLALGLLLGAAALFSSQILAGIAAIGRQAGPGIRRRGTVLPPYMMHTDSHVE